MRKKRNNQSILLSSNFTSFLAVIWPHPLEQWIGIFWHSLTCFCGQGERSILFHDKKHSASHLDNSRLTFSPRKSIAGYARPPLPQTFHNASRQCTYSWSSSAISLQITTKKNYADWVGCYPPTTSEVFIILHIKRKPNSISLCYYLLKIHVFLTP